MEKIAKTPSNQRPIDPQLLQKVLMPYREDTTYLKNVTLSFDAEQQYPSIQGDFAIKESCYIDDTGHFNAVEFNICFNQLAYTYLGYCIKEGILPELADFSENNCEVFFEKQLSNFLIVNIESSYKRPINAKKFCGEARIKTVKKNTRFTFIVMSCKYHDANKGRSFGEVTLAILNP